MKGSAGLLAVSALSIFPVGGVDARTPTPMQASAWEIGPVIKGRNYSLGLFQPTQYERGWGFTISPRAEPHYVTFRHGSLRGKTQIRMRFRVEGPKDAIIYGAKCPKGSPSAVLLYFQRKGDNWRTNGARWWASFAKVSLRGFMAETEIVAPLNARWTSVLKMNAKDHSNEFAAAKANADRVGFTFANCSGYGHGARATVPVKFVVTSFEVL
jgi:hypothetical protein